jgi:hypothetical protein
MTFSIGVLESILCELNAIAVFDDCLACDENVESGIEGIVNTQLMAV